MALDAAARWCKAISGAAGTWMRRYCQGLASGRSRPKHGGSNAAQLDPMGMRRSGQMRGTKALRFFVVTVLTAVAISNAVAAAAQAEPERGTCKATSEGLYKDSLCLEEGGTSEGHEFEWIPAKSASFTATSGNATLRSFTPEGAELPAVECKKSKSKGKAGATTTTSVVTLEDCSSAGEGCTGGANATPGQIVTFELNGKLGYIEGESIVGEDLVGTGPNGLVAEFTCGANTIQTAGSVIGVVAPLDMSTKSFTLTFTSTGEHQAIEAFEGASKDTLQTEINGLGAGTLPFPSAFDVTDVIKDVAK
jgi:hypothetical protein